MNTITVLFCLVSAAAAMPGWGRRQNFGGQGGYNQGSNFNGGYRQPSTATGSATGNVVSGTSSNGYGQTSRITQLSAHAQGSTSGNGISNNHASASNFGSSGPHGNQDFSNTNAVSKQQTFDSGFGSGFGSGNVGGFGGHRQQPSYNNDGGYGGHRRQQPTYNSGGYNSRW